MEPSKATKNDHLEDSTDVPPKSALPENHLMVGISKLEQTLAEKRDIVQKLKKQAEALPDEDSSKSTDGGVTSESLEAGGLASPSSADALNRLPPASELREQIRMLEDYVGEISFILAELHKRLKEEQAKLPPNLVGLPPPLAAGTGLASPSVSSTPTVSEPKQDAPSEEASSSSSKMKRENSGKDKNDKRDMKREDSDKKKDKSKAMKRENSKEKEVDSPAGSRKTESLSAKSQDSSSGEDKSKRRLKGERSNDGSLSAREPRRGKEDKDRDKSEKPPRAPEGDKSPKS